MPTSSLTFRGLCHGGAQTVHVVTPVAVVTEQQLVLGGETCPAGTLGARAPETGVGGWGWGRWALPQEMAPSGVCTVESLQNLAWRSKTPLMPVSLQFVVWVL